MEKYEGDGEERFSIRQCPNCKNVAKDEDLFCSKCGEQIDFKPRVIYDGYSRDKHKSYEHRLIREFVASNADYYIRKFDTQDVTEKDATWNWPAFLFSPMWCFYRKQYVLGLILMGTSFLLNYLGDLGNIIHFGISIYIGFMGNYFYRGYIEKHLENASDMNYEERVKYYEKMGGTSYLAVIVGLCGGVLLSYLFLRG